jgi:hypothetical protein
LSADCVLIPVKVAKDTQRRLVWKRALMVNFDLMCTKIGWNYWIRINGIKSEIWSTSCMPIFKTLLESSQSVAFYLKLLNFALSSAVHEEAQWKNQACNIYNFVVLGFLWRFCFSLFYTFIEQSTYLRIIPNLSNIMWYLSKTFYIYCKGRYITDKAAKYIYILEGILL